ncbi:MAG: putative toxin-antitoxin system toxin component, PIN family [Synergistaceae bacterium]|jgi:putative PIN family toxin of toxin-antitoxin system|nr:putative toxin-antitoxin system toxin component, PIN family [Synergistaceae bacterium]
MSGVRAVLDTNILVSALLSPRGNPAKIYRMFLTEILKLAYSPKILAEYRDVLFRPRLRIAAEEAQKVLEAIREYGEKIEPIPSAHDMIDEDDRMFYDAAIGAGACLITGNKKHYPDEACIMSPAEFLSFCLSGGVSK